MEHGIAFQREAHPGDLRAMPAGAFSARSVVPSIPYLSRECLRTDHFIGLSLSV
jgi:hypothetical protein